MNNGAIYSCGDKSAVVGKSVTADIRELLFRYVQGIFRLVFGLCQWQFGKLDGRVKGSPPPPPVPSVHCFFLVKSMSFDKHALYEGGGSLGWGWTVNVGEFFRGRGQKREECPKK